MKKYSSDWFNHILSNYVVSELTDDELQIFTEMLLSYLKSALKNTSDDNFEYLFKQQVDNLKKDSYWLKRLHNTK
tara:strand:+ start:159 stop:383 length:225 start_codon:yes stop_codon:yes gene_type:complete